MRTYRYGNQYRKVKKSYALEASMAFLLTFYIGMLFLKNVAFAVTPDQLYLETLEFGKYPALNVSVEAKVAGMSAVIVKPIPVTKEEMILDSKHPNEIMHIWEKETSKGTNKNPEALHNLCKGHGKSNEFGYGGMAMKICFNSFQEAVQVVDDWLTKRDMEALCYYNIGVKVTDCSYAAKLSSK